MTGTAAEVTPLALGRRRRDRGRAGHARDPEGVPRTPCAAAASAGRMARVRRARAGRGVSTGTRRDPARAAVPRRARGGARRSRCCARAGSRSGRRSTASRSCSPSASARPTPRPSRAAPRGCTCSCRIAGLGPGDEVITSPFSFVASANCFIYEGATPVFADVDPRTLNLDPAAVEAAITARTKALVAVDIFGYPCELDELRAICERHGLALIEDSAEALGRRVQGPADRLARRPGRLRASTRTSRSRPARAASSRRTPRRSGSCSQSLRNQGRDYEAAAGSTTCGSATTTAGPTCRRRSGSASWRSSTGSSSCAGGGGALRRAARGVDGRAAAAPTTPTTGARGSSTSSSYRPGSTATRDGRAARAGHRHGRVRAVRPPPAVHARDATASPRACARSPRTSASRTLALPFYPHSRPADQERVVEALRAALA